MYRGIAQGALPAGGRAGSTGVSSDAQTRSVVFLTFSFARPGSISWNENEPG
jgi:hypothetical protein